MNDIFPEIVGQEHTKKKLKFYLDSYHQTSLMPNVLLTAGKGCGKTLFAEKIAEQLLEYQNKKPVMKADGVTPKKKSWIPLNAASIPNFRWFAEKVLVPHCVGKASTIFIDECSDLKEDVSTNLLTLLNPNTNNRNTLAFDEVNLDIDFRLNTFIFATTNVEKMNEPLVNRLKRFELQPYTKSDLGKVIVKSIPDVSFMDGVLEDVASVVRGNCRRAVEMALDIKTYLGSNTRFGNSEWSSLKKILSIRPLGLSDMEIQILEFLRDRSEGTSLTSLSAKTGLSRTALQQDYEMYLQSQSLMEIKNQHGRRITSRGMEYLKSLESCPA
jgi:Holliday junction resolvasome RuvABC ATP-dependent DNA helicase subunit